MYFIKVLMSHIYLQTLVLLIMIVNQLSERSNSSANSRKMCNLSQSLEQNKFCLQESGTALSHTYLDSVLRNIPSNSCFHFLFEHGIIKPKIYTENIEQCSFTFKICSSVEIFIIFFPENSMNICLSSVGPFFFFLS